MSAYIIPAIGTRYTQKSSPHGAGTSSLDIDNAWTVATVAPRPDFPSDRIISLYDGRGQYAEVALYTFHRWFLAVPAPVRAFPCLGSFYTSPKHPGRWQCVDYIGRADCDRVTLVNWETRDFKAINAHVLAHQFTFVD